MAATADGERRQALADIVVHSRLADGTAVCLRTITPDDAPLLRAGIAALSTESRYLRFFSPAAVLPEPVIERLVDVDGHDHIGWGAICTECEGEPAIGAVHAVRDRHDGPVAEYSVAVADAFQGQGLGRMLTAALLIDCRAEGLEALDLHVLSENGAARHLVKSLGATWQGESAGVADYRLDVAGALAALRADGEAQGVQDVFAQLAG
jgi:ribosomal protein S18 acetylase RimI-like enzyme